VSFSPSRFEGWGYREDKVLRALKISDLQHDNLNANKGTKRGRKAVVDSLSRYGAGRSILIDRNGKIIAGNQTIAVAAAAGFDEVIVVQSDGTKIIAVQRTDLDLNDTKAKELAIADNRSSELGLEWNPEILGQLVTDLELQPFFTGDELTKIIAPHSDDTTKDVDPAATEIDVDGFELQHTCPRCGFGFNDK
jgi:hypothetical protein